MCHDAAKGMVDRVILVSNDTEPVLEAECLVYPAAP
jgi:hypothetical protein